MTDSKFLGAGPGHWILQSSLEGPSCRAQVWEWLHGMTFWALFPNPRGLYEWLRFPRIHGLPTLSQIHILKCIRTRERKWQSRNTHLFQVWIKTVPPCPPLPLKTTLFQLTGTTLRKEEKGSQLQSWCLKQGAFCRFVPWMYTPSTWATVWMGTHITLELLNSWLSLQETALLSHLLQSREWRIYTFMYTHAVLSTKGWPPPKNKFFQWDSPDQDPDLHSSPIAPWLHPQFNTIWGAKGSLNLSFRKIHTVYGQRKNRNYTIFKPNWIPSSIV